MASISRILPNPPGPDAEGEWIEVCFDIESLSPLYLSDESGESSLIIRKEEGECEKFYRGDTHITLNNDGDTILLSTQETVQDECSYKSVKEGEIITCSEGALPVQPTREEARVIGVEEHVIQEGTTTGDVVITGIFVACCMVGIVLFYLIKNGALLFLKSLDK